MSVNKQLKINNEYFNDNDFQDIIYNYLIKMFKISDNNFELFQKYVINIMPWRTFYMN